MATERASDHSNPTAPSTTRRWSGASGPPTRQAAICLGDPRPGRRAQQHGWARRSKSSACTSCTPADAQTTPSASSIRREGDGVRHYVQSGRQLPPEDGPLYTDFGLFTFDDLSARTSPDVSTAPRFARPGASREVLSRPAQCGRAPRAFEGDRGQRPARTRDRDEDALLGTSAASARLRASQAVVPVESTPRIAAWPRRSRVSGTSLVARRRPLPRAFAQLRLPAGAEHFLHRLGRSDAAHLDTRASCSRRPRRHARAELVARCAFAWATTRILALDADGDGRCAPPPPPRPPESLMARHAARRSTPRRRGWRAGSPLSAGTAWLPANPPHALCSASGDAFRLLAAAPAAQAARPGLSALPAAPRARLYPATKKTRCAVRSRRAAVRLFQALAALRRRHPAPRPRTLAVAGAATRRARALSGAARWPRRPAFPARPRGVPFRPCGRLVRASRRRGAAPLPGLVRAGATGSLSVDAPRLRRPPPAALSSSRRRLASRPRSLRPARRPLPSGTRLTRASGTPVSAADGAA